MPTYSIKINESSIQAKVIEAIGKSKTAKSIANKKAYDLFYRSKNMMLRDFDEHEITQEIKAGPDALNISNTLGGYGNLFSYIGFELLRTPIQGLRIAI